MGKTSKKTDTKQKVDLAKILADRLAVVKKRQEEMVAQILRVNEDIEAFQISAKVDLGQYERELLDNSDFSIDERRKLFREKSNELGRELDEKVEALKLEDLKEEGYMLEQEQKLLEKYSPLIAGADKALADYLPILQEVAEGLSDRAGDVLGVAVADVLAQTLINVWKRIDEVAEKSDADGVWARGVKRKFDALVKAGFDKDQAMAFVLSTTTNPLQSIMKSVVKGAKDVVEKGNQNRKTRY